MSWHWIGNKPLPKPMMTKIYAVQPLAKMLPTHDALTRCGLVKPYGDKKLGQPWPR